MPDIERLGLTALVAICAFLVLPLIAESTRIVHRWVLTGLPMPKLKKVLVIAVVENYLIRQQFEDEMERLLAKPGVQGVRSHMVLPPRNELMEGELKQRIKEDNYDAVLVIRPKAVRKETQEIVTGAIYVPPPGYCTFWPYWNMAYGQVYTTSSYLQENSIVSAEFNLYNTKDEKLLWSGETDTVYFKDFGLSPKDAAFKAREEVSGPVIGIAIVLSAVFIPTAFIPGITGRLYPSGNCTAAKM